MHDLSSEMAPRFVELAQAYSHWEAQAHVIPWERGERYMSYVGFRNYRPKFFQGYRDAMAAAGPDGVIKTMIHHGEKPSVIAQTLREALVL